MIRGSLNRKSAAIGYGFLIGVGIGLTIGVITKSLFFWIVICGLAGIVIGWLISLAR